MQDWFRQGVLEGEDEFYRPLCSLGKGSISFLQRGFKASRPRIDLEKKVKS